MSDPNRDNQERDMGDEENLQLTEFENGGGSGEVQESGDAGRGSTKELDAVYDVPVQVSAVLGRASMQVSQLLKLGRGAVVELDRKVGEAVDIYVNNRLVARGEVVVVEDRLGVTMTEIIKTDRA
jgi:flagellar motor switch protein FliN